MLEDVKVNRECCVLTFKHVEFAKSVRKIAKKELNQKVNGEEYNVCEVKQVSVTRIKESRFTISIGILLSGVSEKTIAVSEEFDLNYMDLSSHRLYDAAANFVTTIKEAMCLEYDAFFDVPGKLVEDSITGKYGSSGMAHKSFDGKELKDATFHPEQGTDRVPTGRDEHISTSPDPKKVGPEYSPRG